MLRHCPVHVGRLACVYTKTGVLMRVLRKSSKAPWRNGFFYFAEARYFWLWKLKVPLHRTSTLVHEIKVISGYISDHSFPSYYVPSNSITRFYLSFSISVYIPLSNFDFVFDIFHSLILRRFPTHFFQITRKLIIIKLVGTTSYEAYTIQISMKMKAARIL